MFKWFVLLCLFSIALAPLYLESVIFPPTVPENRAAMEQMSDFQLLRLQRFLGCGEVMADNYRDPEKELKRLKTYCATVYDVRVNITSIKERIKARERLDLMKEG